MIHVVTERMRKLVQVSLSLSPATGQRIGINPRVLQNCLSVIDTVHNVLLHDVAVGKLPWGVVIK
jgi:YVTN family beta-propeller protein